MKDNLPRYTLRVPQILLDKLGYIAEYEGRSLTWQMIHLMQKCVRDFEREHGPIELPEEDA